MPKPIVGISCLCQDPEGNIIGDPYINNQSDLRERQYVHKLKGEKWGVVLTEVLRQFPYPEVKGFIPDGYVWMEIAKYYDDYTINEPLRIYYHNEPDSLSRIRLSRGMVMYARRMLVRDWRYARYQPFRFLKAAIYALIPLWLFP